MIDKFKAFYGWWNQSDAHSWWGHYFIILLGGAAGYPWLGLWVAAGLVIIYWGREVYQIWRRGKGFQFKWKDDLPDFLAPVLGLLTLAGITSGIV